MALIIQTRLSVYWPSFHSLHIYISYIYIIRIEPKLCQIRLHSKKKKMCVAGVTEHKTDTDDCIRCLWCVPLRMPTVHLYHKPASTRKWNITCQQGIEKFNQQIYKLKLSMIILNPMLEETYSNRIIRAYTLNRYIYIGLLWNYGLAFKWRNAIEWEALLLHDFNLSRIQNQGICWNFWEFRNFRNPKGSKVHGANGATEQDKSLVQYA